MVFFQCVLLTHHVGHISLRDRRPKGLAIVPHAPCGSARSTVLEVVGRRPTRAIGSGAHPLAYQKWCWHDLSPGVGDQAGADEALRHARGRAGTVGPAI